MNAPHQLDACARYEALTLTAAEDELSLDEFEFKLQHEDTCEVCGFGHQIDELLAFDDSDDGPLDTLDDLARRRWIHEVVEQADSIEEEPRQTGRGPRRTVYVAFAAAAAIGVILGGLGVMMLTDGPAVPSVTVVAQNFSARSLLVAGKAHTAGGPLLPGQELKEGDTVRVESGRVALGLPSNITLMLEKGSEIKLEKLNEENFLVALSDGAVLASVDPTATRPGFSVATDAGVVTVTGTVFSVRKDHGKTDVRVLRGSVKLSEPNRASRRVKTSQGSVLGGDEIFEIDPKEATELREQKMMLDMLNPTDVGSTLVFKSQPSGATVYIDGATVGTTPLIASVSPGAKRVEVAMVGYESVRRVMDVEPGRTTSRTLTLKVVPPKRVVRRAPKARRTTAASLLEDATAKRRAKKWRDAAAAYEELLRTHPRSPQASVARISLADIELDHMRRPAVAIKHYDAYLRISSSGVVAQEAEYGRIRALRALGRTQREKNEIANFIAKHPGAMQTGMLKARLEVLNK